MSHYFTTRLWLNQKPRTNIQDEMDQALKEHAEDLAKMWADQVEEMIIKFIHQTQIPASELELVREVRWEFVPSAPGHLGGGIEYPVYTLRVQRRTSPPQTADEEKQ
jgi:hypothetical protein